MNFKLAAGVLLLGAAFALTTGCSVDSSESSASESDDIVAAPVNVVGSFRAKPGVARSTPSFEGIVFERDGSFFADVNTGIMCITTPCPTEARIEGTYTVVGRSVILSAKEESKSTSYHGRYGAKVATDGTLTLSRGSEIVGVLAKATSYCSEAADCGGQGLIHPMCVGAFTCGEQRSCGYRCGIVPVDSGVWPGDRTQLVAETKGGGFTPPPPPGSDCAVGAAKYTFDVAAKKITWAVCDFADWSTPMHTVTGSRVLSDAEVSTIDAAMNGVKITHREICGADKPYLDLKVTTSRGTKTYTDSFYSCMGGDRTFVDNIDEVFSAFRDLAK